MGSQEPNAIHEITTFHQQIATIQMIPPGGDDLMTRSLNLGAQFGSRASFDATVCYCGLLGLPRDSTEVGVVIVSEYYFHGALHSVHVVKHV